MPKADKSGRMIMTIGVPNELYADYVEAVEKEGLSLPDSIRLYMRAVVAGEISLQLKIKRG
jgi:hypothetical protein